MKVPYHCTHTGNAFKEYYLKQAGCGLPTYAGSRYQKGHGFFSNLFRSAIPIIKKAGLGIAKHLLNTGSNIITDVNAGESIRSSAKKRFKETGQNVLSSIGINQSGGRFHSKTHKKSQSKKRKLKGAKRSVKRQCKRSQTPDIFG